MPLQKFLIFALIIIGVLFFSPQEAQAQNVCTQPIVPCGYPVCCEAALGRDLDGDGTIENNYPPGCNNNPNQCRPSCELCHIFCLILNLINFVLLCLVPPLALAFLVIGALVLMFAGGSPGLMSRAKSILKSVIIGLFITYGAYLLVSAFLTMIGVQHWTGLATWFQPAINCPGCGGAGAPVPPAPAPVPPAPPPHQCTVPPDECATDADCPPGTSCNPTTCTCELSI